MSLSLNTSTDHASQVPRCQKRMQAACIDQFDRIDCAAASDFCWQLGDVYVGEYQKFSQLLLVAR